MRLKSFGFFTVRGTLTRFSTLRIVKATDRFDAAGLLDLPLATFCDADEGAIFRAMGDVKIASAMMIVSKASHDDREAHLVPLPDGSDDALFAPEQDENGIDLSAIRANLRLTPQERLEKLERSLATLHLLQNARRIEPTTESAGE